MDHSNAATDRIPWRTKPCLFSFDIYFTAIGQVDARQDIHQRGLARTVFSKQRVDFSSLQYEIDAVVCDDGTEALADRR